MVLFKSFSSARFTIWRKLVNVGAYVPLINRSDIGYENIANRCQSWGSSPNGLSQTSEPDQPHRDDMGKPVWKTGL